MAFQPETATYDAGVYQIEITDAVLGGVGGIANASLLNLADRTAYLKVHVDALEASIAGFAPLNSPTFTGSPTAPTAPAGDNSTKISNTAFVENALFGIATVAVAGSNITLTQAQWGEGIIVFTGALTANINVVFPNSGRWIISNQSSGAFAITCKTSAGTGIAPAQGKNSGMWADGTNVLQAHNDYTNAALLGTPTAPTPTAGDSSTKVATTAFIQSAIGGVASVNVAGGVDVTLTGAQFGCGVVILTGALTGNINVVFPTTGKWIVVNQTTGAFTIKCKTPLGTGIFVDQGFNSGIVGDGTNIQQAMTDFISPNLQGVPIAPTQSPGDSTTKLATTAFVTAAVAAGAANNVFTNVANNFSVAQGGPFGALTDAASVAWPVNTKQIATLTIGGNRTLANPTGQVAGRTYILIVTQDATGSRTLGFGTAYKYPGGVTPLLSVAAGSVDILTFISDGTNMYGVAQNAFA